ncbi:MAG: hypothetical protein K1X71_19895 [Pirellulales bacterium]|nr:hypothetical protein [Pirellulales bacterium]
MKTTAPSEVRKLRRRVGFRVVSLLLGLAAGLVVAELAVRLLDVRPVALRGKLTLYNQDDASVDYHCYPSNPHGELTPPPDLTRGRWKLINYAKQEFPLTALSDAPWVVEYRRSRHKMRNRDLPPQPPAGVTRIALVGDSFVYGEGAPEPLTLPRQMAALLGEQFELVNGGWPGANTATELANARYLVDELGCRRIILVFTANDVELTPKLAARQNFINDLINVRDLHLSAASQSQGWGHSRLLQLVGTRFFLNAVTRDTIEWYRDCYRPEQNGANLEKLAAQFRALAEMPECRSALVLYPLLEGLEADYPLASVHATVSQLARAAELPVLDLAPALAGQTSCDLWAHDCDHHPNGKAHRLAARAIVDWLRTDQPALLEAP